MSGPVPAKVVTSRADAPRRGKGRPRVTSQEKIIEAGMAIAAANPTAILSVVAIAKKLEIAPMAIYNYFPSRDALMQKLSARLLEKMAIDVGRAANPFETIEVWARAARTHFLQFPELLQILDYENGYTSSAWLAKSEALFRAMEMMGFAGEELVKSIRWLWNVVMSAIAVEIQDSLSPSSISDRIDHETNNYVKDTASMMQEISQSYGFYERLFDFHVGMAINGLRNASSAIISTTGAAVDP